MMLLYSSTSNIVKIIIDSKMIKNTENDMEILNYLFNTIIIKIYIF